jgi:hypothetical protein
VRFCTRKSAILHSREWDFALTKPCRSAPFVGRFTKHAASQSFTVSILSPTKRIVNREFLAFRTSGIFSFQENREFLAFRKIYEQFTRNLREIYGGISRIPMGPPKDWAGWMGIVIFLSICYDIGVAATDLRMLGRRFGRALRRAWRGRQREMPGRAGRGTRDATRNAALGMARNAARNVGHGMARKAARNAARNAGHGMAPGVCRMRKI